MLALQVASRIVSAFTTYKKYDKERQVRGAPGTSLGIEFSRQASGMAERSSCVRSSPHLRMQRAHAQCQCILFLACQLLLHATKERALLVLLLLQALMRAQLQRIADTEGISENVYEIVSKSLKD